MKEKYTTTAIVPARKGSIRFPGKNIFPLLGKPLILYTLEQIRLAGNAIDKVVVSTDCPEVAKISSEFGMETTPNRPEWLCTSDAATVDVVKHEIQNNDIKGIVILLQPTSPFRRSFHIKESLKCFRSNSKKKLVSVRRPIEKMQWVCEMNNASNDCSLTSPVFGIDLPELVVPNGAIYIAYSEDISSGGDLSTAEACPYLMNAEDSIDIDSLSDMAKAESIMQSRNLNKIQG